MSGRRDIPDDAPRIEFPCDYPIKVVGTHHEQFTEEVLLVVGNHTERVREADTRLKISRNGTYASLTVTVLATGEPQLKRMHRDLMALESVKMVL